MDCIFAQMSKERLVQLIVPAGIGKPSPQVMSAVYYRLSTVCRLPSAICCLLFDVCCLPSAVCCVLFTVCC
jgi:hypothetical protein